MDRTEWLSMFEQKADEVFPHLPSKFTSETLREEVIFGGIKIVDDPKFWNAGLNGILKAWLKEGRVKKGPAVRAQRKAARGALVWTYIKVDVAKTAS